MDKHETKPTFASMAQVIDLQRLAGKAFLKMPKSKADQILGTAKGQQAFITEMQEKYTLPVSNERALVAVPLLINFFKKVFGLDIPEIAELQFPEHEAIGAYMVEPGNQNEDQIMEAVCTYFKVEKYKYRSPIVENINREEESRVAKRPSKLYPYGHRNEDGPDAVYRTEQGISYNDAVAKQMTFAKANEYLRMTAFKKFTEQKWMDAKGWTRCASLWSHGGLVHGYWHETRSKLNLGYGSRGYRLPGSGPRELFL